MSPVGHWADAVQADLSLGELHQLASLVRSHPAARALEWHPRTYPGGPVARRFVVPLAWADDMVAVRPIRSYQWLKMAATGTAAAACALVLGPFVGALVRAIKALLAGG